MMLFITHDMNRIIWFQGLERGKMDRQIWLWSAMEGLVSC